MSTITDSQLLEYNQDHWCNLITLSTESIEYFWSRIKYSQQSDIMYNHMLAGNISKSLAFFDNEDFIPNRLFKDIIADKLDFYSNKIQKNLTQPVLTGSWINFQKKYEFNPLHYHSGILSFVIWINVPYLREDENENNLASIQTKGSFHFVFSNILGQAGMYEIPISKEYENVMILFPSKLAHEVYPFYTSNDYRISLSGNIRLARKL